MPSTYSVSKAIVLDSSTVTTPSLPTLSMTSAMSSPISASAALTVATWAISWRPLTGCAASRSACDTAAAAFSMPSFICIGLAPEATFLRPSLTIAWASTVAVVVPSPATSSVLVAASLSSCAPMFSNGSESSMSLATVTPSWTTFGAPYFLSSATLGPKGRNVALDKKYGAPNVVHDGVTVAKDIELSDPFENMGAQLLKEAATKTEDVAGDGTTTATVLAQAIVNEGLKNVASGANPMQMKLGIEKAAAAVSQALRDAAQPVKGRQEIAQVATVSAADAEIGELIAEVMDKVGKDGVVTVEESKTMAFETEYVEGMQFDRGYVSAYFVTDTNRMESILEDPHILITDRKISAIADILPTLEKLVQVGRKDMLLI